MRKTRVRKNKLLYKKIDLQITKIIDTMKNKDNQVLQEQLEMVDPNFFNEKKKK